MKLLCFYPSSPVGFSIKVAKMNSCLCHRRNSFPRARNERACLPRRNRFARGVFDAMEMIGVICQCDDAVDMATAGRYRRAGHPPNDGCGLLLLPP